MAYTGINKANWESSRYSTKANARRNAVSTVVNTGMQVGQTLIENSMRDKLDELNNQANIDLTKAEQEIYANTAPEEREAKLNEKYSQYAETATKDLKTWSTVKDDFKKTLEERKSKTISSWTVNDTTEKINASRAFNTGKLETLVSSTNIIESLKTTGIIKSKDTGKTKNTEESDSLSSGFIGVGTSKIGKEEDISSQSIVFSQEIQDAYESGASEFDMAVMGIEYYAKKLYPFSKEMQGVTVEKYTNILRDTMPSNDLQLLFTTSFSDKNVENWDYATFRKGYLASLETDTYGGQPISVDKKQQLSKELDTMWSEFVSQKTAEAQDFYTNNIAGTIKGLKTALAKNSNKLYTTDDVNKAFDDALKDNPVYAKFLIPQREAELNLGYQNEWIIAQNEFKSLYNLKRNRTEEQNQKFIELGKVFSPDEIVSLKQGATLQYNMGVSEITDGLNQLISAGRLDQNLTKETVTEFLDSKGVTNPILKEQAYNQVKAYTQEQATRDFYSEYMNGPITDERFDELMKDVDDPHFVAGMKEIKDNSTNQKANDAVFKLINDENFTQEGLDTIISKYGITDENVKNIWQNQLESVTLKNLSNKLEAADKDGNLTNSEFSSMLSESGVDYEKNSGVLNQYYNKAIQNSLNNANSELGAMLYRETLNEKSIEKVAGKYGITVDKYPEFFNTWKQQAESSWQTHLSKIDSESKGFSDKSTQESTSAVGVAIKDFTDGKISKSKALELLASNRTGLTETDYKNAFNDINNEDVIKNEASQSKFEEAVYKPFYDEQDSIMPGTSRKRLLDAGLDPSDFATELSKMEDAEALNQHHLYVESYTENQTYLALRQRGLSDDSIRELGLYVPDMSFQNTIQWMNDNPNQKPMTAEEYAMSKTSEAKGKMITDTLPSGTSLTGASSTAIDKSVTTSADLIYKNVISNASAFAKYNNAEAINMLDLKKFELEDTAYDSLALEYLKSGKITEKEYTTRVGEDVSIYKGEQYKQKQDALKLFQGYVKDRSKTTTNAQGNNVTMSDYLVNSVIDNYTAQFNQEYDYAVQNSNGAPVDAKLIAEKVYLDLSNSKYSELADGMLNILSSDTSQMFSGFFGKNEQESFGQYQEFMKGVPLFSDPETLKRMLSDPSTANAGFGTDSANFAKWQSMNRNGVSSTEIADQIAYDVAKNIGLDPPALDEDFRNNFEKYIETLPDFAKAQWSQTSMISKWTYDIYNNAKRNIDPAIIDSLSPDGEVTPIIKNNEIGVDIGGTEFFYSPGSQRGDDTFYTSGENGEETKLSTRYSDYMKATETFKNSMSEMFVYGNLVDSNFRKAGALATEVNGELVVDAGLVKDYVGDIIKNNKNSMKKIEQQYLSTVNNKSLDLKGISGKDQQLFTGVEYYVNESKINEAIANNTILATPFDEFIGYRLIPAIQ
jgi:hypothetical protein